MDLATCPLATCQTALSIMRLPPGRDSTAGWGLSDGRASELFAAIVPLILYLDRPACTRISKTTQICELLRT